jgi:hypothetical protein
MAASPFETEREAAETPQVRIRARTRGAERPRPGPRVFADDLARGEVPGIRRIRAEMHVGQPRAREIQDRLRALAAVAEGM